MKTLPPPPKKNGKPPLSRSLKAPGISAPGKTHFPDDFATNHDFYLYGAHKQQPRHGRWISNSKDLRPPTPAQVAALNRKMDQLAEDLDGIPADLSKNLDHYLHGHPKK